MLTPEQCRAARGWLDWSQDDLAKLAHVSLSTVRDFEKGRRTPIANNLKALRRAIEAAGVQLVLRRGEPVGIAIFDPQPEHEGA
jgi:DNA-binding transcriptional regulator YiaG